MALLVLLVYRCNLKYASTDSSYRSRSWMVCKDEMVEVMGELKERVGLERALRFEHRRHGEYRKSVS